MEAIKAYSYIRFSTREQEKGDSQRRQEEQSEAYAKEHGLTLDDSLLLPDLGLSAYNGSHITKGHLGTFLGLVEQGKIAKGSVLLVENLDRLSRDKVFDAFNQFRNIIGAGIRIVTLQDKIEYTKESIDQNWAQLIISITYMARAYDESKRKSQRLKAAWEEKRKKAINGERKITRRVPAWIKTQKDEITGIITFTPIPESCKAVESIFRKKLEGKGSEKIARELNFDPDSWKPPKSKRSNAAGGWRKSYINKILSNRAVIGEYQPHKFIEETKDDKKTIKRVPEGEPIEDYFPSAIDKDLFYQVQELILRNSELRGCAGGKTGKASNLFVHIGRCGRCGSPMHFINKGSLPKGGQYLYCDAARRLKTCSAKPIRYDEFEQLFFDNFEELDIDRLIPGEDELKANLNELEKQIESNTAQRRIINEEIENLMDSVRKTKDARVRDLLDKELIKAMDQREQLQADRKQYEQESRDLSHQRTKLRENIDQSMEIYKLLASVTDEQERIDIRLKLREEIKKLVEWIKIYPLQEKYIEIEEIEPGIIKSMHSKYIDRVRIKFRSGKKLRVLYLKRFGEII